MHDSRDRPTTPEYMEGHGLALGYDHIDNPHSPAYDPIKAIFLRAMADPIDSAL